MRAGDLTKADIGAVVTVPLEDVNVVGKLLHLSWPIGMVRLGLSDADDESKVTFFVVPSDKDVALTHDHLRFRAVTEPDTQQRGKYLHEINHQRVLAAVVNLLPERPQS